MAASEWLADTNLVCELFGVNEAVIAALAAFLLAAPERPVASTVNIVSQFDGERARSGSLLQRVITGVRRAYAPFTKSCLDELRRVHEV